MVKRSLLSAAAAFALAAACSSVGVGASPAELKAVIAETLHPYSGIQRHGGDASTMVGKVLCGYQGWFNGEGDGAGRGFHRWTKNGGPFEPGNAKIDLWPDLSDHGPDERFPTGLRHANGQTAEVFSSYRRETVLRHFEWMREHAIDGVFVQRFIAQLQEAHHLRHNNVVLAHCREAANRAGRDYAVMYDLSGLGENRIAEVIADWHALRTSMAITDDPAYLRHRGRPVVVIWGVGFRNRAYTLTECAGLIRHFQADDCTVMLGVPTGWRTLDRDSVADPTLHEVLQLADVVSPWTVGRYTTPAEATRHGEEVWTADIAWCRDRAIDYLPVVFPGFSWGNMKGRAFNRVPREEGRFLWSQFVAAREAGAGMVYVAMFDEVDEGTAIFKCTNSPPVSSADTFLSYEGLPSDHYLRLTGDGGRLIRGESLLHAPP